VIHGNCRSRNDYRKSREAEKAQAQRFQAKGSHDPKTVEVLRHEAAASRREEAAQ
jgi:hypothetical protein